MKVLHGILFLALFFTACNSSNPDMNETAGMEDVDRIEIPFREHGYSELPSQVIDTQEGLEKLIKNVESQAHWNNKLIFVNTLENEKIEFEKKNLLLYRMTESSGSVGLEVVSSSVEGEVIHIHIKRTPLSDGMMGTADMAYYMLAYQVDKFIEMTILHIGDKEVYIANEKSEMIVPKNCLSWHDGCNNCARAENGASMCTLMACLAYRPQDFKCTKWE